MSMKMIPPIDGYTFQGLQDALRAHPKRRIEAVRHRIDHHPQIRERGGGQPDTVDVNPPDESHRPDQCHGQPSSGTSRVAISDT